LRCENRKNEIKNSNEIKNTQMKILYFPLKTRTRLRLSKIHIYHNRAPGTRPRSYTFTIPSQLITTQQSHKETMDNQAFLSSAYDEENFAALDSMNPTPFNKPPENPPGASGSLFDRIRARTEEQQKASATAQQQQQQQQSSCEPTMELEKSNPFDAAVHASIGAPPPTNTNETTYAFSGPSDFSHVPTYGPSRNEYISVDNSQQYNSNLTLKDRASSAFTSIVDGAQSLVGTMQEKIGGRVATGGGGYNTNFLLREDGLEGGVGATTSANMGSQQQQQKQKGGADLSFVSGKAYSMFSYGKTFCEDMIGFFLQLPHWGKGLVVLVLVLFVKFLFFW
jgi:hypothetical protein